MKVIPIVPRGYCKGVVRAIQIAKECAKKYPNEPIYILGMIVHNQYIVDALTNLGIQTIDHKGKTRLELLDEIDKGIVLITAHGAGKDVFEKGKKKGLTIIDATCVDVIKTHDLIKQKISEGKEILYVGKQGHPESEGTLAIDKDHIHLIEKETEIDKFIGTNQAYVLTNQTTMSIWDIENISNYANEVLDNIEISKETCTATQIRQEAISNIDEEVDLVIIVGDPHSNNTTRLAAIAKEKAHKDVWMVESIKDIDIEELKTKQCVAVSSGASTPTYLTNQIINFLRKFPDEQEIPEIDYSHILD